MIVDWSMLQRVKHLLKPFLVMTALFGLAACISQPDQTLRILYEQSAQYHKPDRNPVIVIPGILGTRLVDDASGRTCLLYTSPSPRDLSTSRMPSSA